MDQKIAWYKEIIELEPSSKIFFPLARLLVRDGHGDCAIDVLRKGLCHHKDFFEARLMLIELLHNAGDTAACDTEVRVLLASFAEYPQFWNAWGACLAHDGAHSDVSLAMRFIIASQKCSDISFASLVDKGLQSYENQSTLSLKDEPQVSCDMTLQGDDTRASLGTLQRALDVHDAPIEVRHDVEVVQALDYADFLLQEEHKNIFEESLVQESIHVRPSDADSEVEEAVSDLLEKHVSHDVHHSTLHDEIVETHDSPSFVSADAVKIISEAGLCHTDALYAECDDNTTSDELFTLRTRSMAEVLLSQGDVQGALSIYEELLYNEKVETVRLELQERIDALQQNKNCLDTLDVVHESSHGQEKLLHMLTLLAERLDSRAQ